MAWREGKLLEEFPKVSAVMPVPSEMKKTVRWCMCHCSADRAARDSKAS
jgi:hypothetical protein